MLDTPTTPDPPKPRRRWYQFRLRTLLMGVVLLAVLCAYVAHEAAIVAARRAWLAAHHAAAFDESAGPAHPSHPDKAPTAIRRWLGDKIFSTVWVHVDADLLGAQTLFPEAEIVSVERWNSFYWGETTPTVEASIRSRIDAIFSRRR
jgi:hypothetical protein